MSGDNNDYIVAKQHDDDDDSDDGVEIGGDNRQSTADRLSRADLTEGSDFVLKDRYGFFLTDEFHQEREISKEERQKRIEKEIERTRKWVRMLKQWSRYFYTDKDIGSSTAKLKSRVRKGIPDRVRGYAWYEFLRIQKSVKARVPNPYDIDTSVITQTTREEIERDIDRTFPRHVMFVEDGGIGQSSLRRLLQWYAALDPEVGYCQGMGFIAGLFLTYMIEEQAFYAFYATLMRPSAPLRMLYLPRLTETQKILFVYEELCKMHLGKLWTYLSEQGMHPTMFFTEWIMCIFCRGFSFDLVTRVWDIFLHEGDMKIVYRVSLALLKTFEEELMGLRFEKIMNFIRNIANRVDAKVVMDIAWKIPLKRAQIQKLEEQHMENVRIAEEKKNAKLPVKKD